MSASPQKTTTVSIPDFWKLVAESELFSSQQCRKLHGLYGEAHGGNPPDKATALAQWLVAQKHLTRYQAKVLLAGKAGPFLYGEYQLTDRVGEGPLKGCFRALHGSTRHPVLLQFLTGPELKAPAQWAAVKQWCDALCQLKHPHLHRWYECVESGNYRFAVSEDLTGQLVSELVAGGRLPVSRACWLVQQMAAGAEALHQRGLVSSQLRPGTAWLAAGNTVKLLLHGLAPATLLVAEPESIAADYRAPELFVTGQTPTVLSDVYALGCTLYHLLTGQPPFADGTLAEKAARHATEPIRPLEGVKAPATLGQVVAYMMAKNPAVRYARMTEVMQQLEPFVGDEPHLLPPVPASPTLARYEAVLAARMPPPVPVAAVAPQASTSPLAALPPQAAAPELAPTMAYVPVASPLAAPAGPAPMAAPLPATPKPATPMPATPMAAPMAVQAAAPSAAGPVATVPTAAAPLAPAIQIAVQPKTAARRRPRQRGSALYLFGGTLLVGLIAAAAWYQWGRERPSAGPPTGPGDAPPLAATTPGDTEAGSGAASGEGALPDDGKSLWASPTAGAAVDLAGVPPESLLTMAIRPADILAHPEGPRVLEALGPSYEQLRAVCEAATGTPWGDIEQLVVSLHEQGLEPPRPAMVVRLKEPTSRSELLARWGQPAEAATAGDKYLKGGQRSYYVLEEVSAVDATESSAAESSAAAGSAAEQSAADANANDSDAAEQGRGEDGEPERGGGAAAESRVRAFVCGHEDEIQLVAEHHGAAPPPRSGTEPLLRASDGTRMLSIFFVPHFWRSNLLRDGREFYFGAAHKLREPLDWFLGDGLRAGTFSLHLGDDQFYAELQLSSDLTRDKFQLATDLRERLHAIPLRAETYIAQRLNPPEYWRRVAFRYPQMIQYLHDQARVEVENNLTIMNAVLPLPAAHNLVFATEMVLASEPGAAVATAAPPEKTGPASIEEALNEKISLTFDQLALEAALAAIADDIRSTYPKLPFEFDVKIIGEDFEKGSITRNQQIVSFDMREASVADVLTAIAMRANPITTVKSPAEDDQKLVWAVGPDPDKPSRTIVLLTTRDGAAARKLTLPPVFQP